jgi:hypothetical protein
VIIIRREYNSFAPKWLATELLVIVEFVLESIMSVVLLVGDGFNF